MDAIYVFIANLKSCKQLKIFVNNIKDYLYLFLCTVNASDAIAFVCFNGNKGSIGF